MIRRQHLLISALYLDTHLLTVRKFIQIFPSSADETALNTGAMIQLCVSVSKGQLAIIAVSPSLRLI